MFNDESAGKGKDDLRGAATRPAGNHAALFVARRDN
jgi:hypothetical protein